MTDADVQPRPRSSMMRLRQVAFCKQQLGALEALGYVASWQHQAEHANHYFTIALANGGVHNRLSLVATRRYLSGLLAGAQGRETSVHLTQYDWGVLYTALAKELTLQQDLDEPYSEEIISSVNRLMAHFKTQQGFQ